MGDLIPFPLDRRLAQIAQANTPNADTVHAGVTVAAAPGDVEYARGAYWFGVRIRPEGPAA